MYHTTKISGMNTKVLKKFGERVKELRLEKGISQEELAEKVNVHRTYIGFIERGERNPALLNIYKISRALGVKLQTLFIFDK